MSTSIRSARPGRRKFSRTPLARAVAAGVGMLLLGPAVQAYEFETSPDWQVRWDNTGRYNAMSRVQGQNKKVTSNLITDDADLSFDKGLVSNRFDLISEMDVVWQDRFGFRVSGAAWYDSVYFSDNDYPEDKLGWGSPSVKPGRFNDHAKELSGKDAELLDAFVFGNFRLGETDLGVRAGRHTLFWGQSLLTSGAIQGIAAAMAPIDAVKAFSVPGSEAQELFMPTNQISATWQLNPALTFKGYYSLEFQEHRLPAVGTYFSPSEYLNKNAEFAALLPSPQLDRVYGLQGVGQEEPDSSGYGLGAQYNSSALDAEFGLYYLNYADKLPQGQVAELNALQVPNFAGGACNPSVRVCGDPLSSTDYAVGRFKTTYKKDIELYGLTLSKELWGISFGSDLVYRRDVALNPDIGSVFTGRIAIPNVVDSGFDGLNDSNYGGPVGDTYHVVLNAFGFLPVTSLWDGGNYIVEFTGAMLDKVTENEQYLNALVKEDNIATTLAVNVTPEWYQLMNNVDFKLPISVSYGLKNFSPLILGGNEKVGNASIAASFLYNQELTVEARYSNSFGPVKYGATTKDRDFVSLTIKYTY